MDWIINLFDGIMDWIRCFLFSKMYSHIDSLYDVAIKYVERVNSAFKILRMQEDEIKRLHIEVIRLSKVLRISGNEIDRLIELTEDLVTIGVDVHFKSPHTILIFSKLNGGQLRHIDADLSSMKDLCDLTRHLKERYGTKRCFMDTPYPNEHNYFLHGNWKG